MLERCGLLAVFKLHGRLPENRSLGIHSPVALAYVRAIRNPDNPIEHRAAIAASAMERFLSSKSRARPEDRRLVSDAVIELREIVVRLNGHAGGMKEHLLLMLQAENRWKRIKPL